MSLLAIVVMAVITISSCTKEGPAGPAGADGTNGTNGTAGTNGTNGINGVVIASADQAAYNAADANAGGLYYNKFWVSPTTGATLTTADTAVTNHADFFRCKACHGWDLLGSNGYYISRGPTATRPNVAPNNLNSFAETHNIKEIFDAVKHSGGRQKISNNKSLNSSMPDYGTLMSDAQVWDIVKYLKTARINTDLLYDLKTTGTYPTGSYSITNLGKNGDAAAGDAYWTAKCASCHAADGTSNNPAPGETIGFLARNKTGEMNHLVKFGLPDQSMFGGSFVHTITQTEMLNLNKALANTTKYIN